MTDWDFIREAAIALGVKPNNAKQWRLTGVPHKYRIALLEAADRAGFELDKAAFDNPPRQPRQKAQAA